MFKKTISLLLFPIAFTGCNSEDLETANFGSSFYKNDYTLVNATDLEIDYHIANTQLDGDPRDVEKNKYYIDTLSTDSEPKSVTHEHNTNREITFYIQDHTHKTKRVKKTYKVKNEQDYHFIAWQNNERLNLSIIQNQSKNKSSFFAIRFLASTDMPITINSKTFNLEQGEISNWYYVDDCNSDIKFNNEPLSICHTSYDNSYTLVLDKSGIKATITE
ncbi:hypothetical protein B5G52_12140 [Pseudoalteromonas sp. A601]|uniref:hypothetical protein n=1 Tax=Pseudoalteromonas sp. A601 TaxID=1967839 RepID=UPI000B3C7CC9|nr:hypothetical protein [Pseudoalteromonas sp. A601]OUS71283.1 hypothetical protein B5G52_12140 [Pseudoalteromonas sp. A601]